VEEVSEPEPELDVPADEAVDVEEEAVVAADDSMWAPPDEPEAAVEETELEEPDVEEPDVEEPEIEQLEMLQYNALVTDSPVPPRPAPAAPAHHTEDTDEPSDVDERVTER
jgi:hypothetical protein